MAYLSKVNIQGNDVLIKDTEARNSITQINSDIAQEVLDRQAADTALGDRITQEVSDRQTADTALGDRISHEAGVRESADNAINTRIDNLGANFGRRRYILLGDSYGYGIQGGGQPWSEGWLGYCARTLGTDVYYLNQSTDPVEGTIGFASTLPFINVLQAIDQRTPIPNKETITDIVVIGGNNDTAGESTIKNAVRDFVQYAKNIYPNAQIKIGVLGYKARNLYDNNQMYFKYRAAANEYGCAFISDLLMLAIDPQYYSDGTHVTAAGYAYINPYIANAVITGHCSYCQTAIVPLTPNTSVITLIGQIDYGLRVDWNEKGYRAAIIDTYRNAFFPFRPANPTTSGTLAMPIAFSATNHMIQLPKQSWPFSNLRRYGQQSNGSHSLIGRGTAYIGGNDISLNGGFYIGSIVTGAGFTEQFIDLDYPSTTIAL